MSGFGSTSYVRFGVRAAPVWKRWTPRRGVRLCGDLCRLGDFLPGQFLCSTWGPFLRSLIAATNASAFFPLFFLPCFAAFFCSTAPQAFFRPDRRFRKPARAEAVKVGRRSVIEAHSDLSRPRLDSFEHGGRLDDHGPEERSVVELNPFRSRGLMSLPDPPFSTRSKGHWPQHGLRVSMPLCPERT